MIIVICPTCRSENVVAVTAVEFFVCLECEDVFDAIDSKFKEVLDD